jgi:hypothetical protein
VDVIKSLIMCVGTDNKMYVTNLSKYNRLKFETLELLESAL